MVCTYKLFTFDRLWRTQASERGPFWCKVRVQTVLPLHQIKTVKREMKRRRMVCINNTPVEDDGCRLKPDSSSGIYTNAVNNYQ